MRTLQTAADVRRFFRENRTPVYYVSTTTFNLLGADEWVGGLRFLGERLRRVGYLEYFGLDFLLDQDTGALYLGELNPRITGATPLTSQAALDAGSVPLLLYHLLEWFDADYRADVAEFNDQWLAPPRTGDWAQLIIEHTAGASEVVTGVPASGVWRLAETGSSPAAGCSPTIGGCRPARKPGSAAFAGSSPPRRRPRWPAPAELLAVSALWSAAIQRRFVRTEKRR